jgi:hypothetical protein
MLRVCLQQRKLFVGTGADFLRKQVILLPKIRSSAMPHRALERLNSTVLFVVQSAVDGLVQAACGKVGLNASIEGLRAVLVKPQVQFLQLSRRERCYCAFDLLDRV